MMERREFLKKTALIGAALATPGRKFPTGDYKRIRAACGDFFEPTATFLEMGENKRVWKPHFK